MVSIIIPVYNGEKYIERCIKSIIRSVKNQKYEIIIVNDGSTDSTEEVCNKIKNSKIKYFFKENGGVSSAREYGILKATGDWIIFVDADDEIAEDMIGDIDGEHAEVEWVIFSDKCQEVDLIDAKKTYNDLIKGIFGFSDVYKGIYLNAVWSKAYKKDIIIKNNIKFDNNIFHGEDMLFNAEYLKYVTYIKFIKKNVYKYIINSESATHRYQKEIISNDIEFLKQAKKYFSTEYSEVQNNEYRKMVLNGLWISLNQYIVHSENKDKYKNKILEMKKIVSSEPYNTYLKELEQIPMSRKIIFIFLKLKMFNFVYVLLKIKRYLKK